MIEPYRIEGQDWEIGEKLMWPIEDPKTEETFRGFVSDGWSGPGVYYDETKRKWVFLDSKIDPDLLNATKTTPTIRKQSASHIKTSTPVTEKTSVRSDPDNVFKLNIHDEDDEMVQAIKEAINARELTYTQISDYPEYSYNLLYGLKQRRSIKFNSFKKWAKILNLKIHIQLLPKDKS